MSFESKYTNNLGRYLKEINERYSKKQNISLTDILDSFRQIPKNSFNEAKVNEKEYSSYIFDELSYDEQQEFINDQLQFIECLVVNSIYDKSGIVWNWKNIYDLNHSENYRDVDKIQRKVVYPTSTNNRPIGDIAYAIWNGLQIIDLDIKDEDLSPLLKGVIFEELKKYNWFLGISKSASKKSLHVWTKITPISLNPDNKRIEYFCNFRHKYSFVYIVLSKYKDKFINHRYTKEDIYSFMDLAMAKPQQGIFIPYDNTALLNTNFKDFRLDVNFETSFTSGIESIDWISHPDLKEIFSKLEWFNNEEFSNDKNIKVESITNINERNKEKSIGAKHYKHNARWQLANTLTNLYGAEKALEILLEICKDTSARELKGDVRTASIHNKPISIWAVNELNTKHGFNIKIKDESIYNVEKKPTNTTNNENSEKALLDPIKILNNKNDITYLKLKSNQYLSDIQDEIINNLSHITLLEAGAGYGKTEMIKQLKAKTLLILPFTSTIKAKVEASETTKDWLYFYGSKRPTLDDILGNKNMSMTIDKFSRLNVMELDQGDFEYIVIDESHLLFTSSYRDVMSPAIQRLANCKAKIIMMTGTPTGELLFFPGIKHIKVIKEDFRIKEFSIHMCATSTEQLTLMCKSMAEDIKNNKKILFPSNKGNLYFEQVKGLVQQYLNEDTNIDKEIRAFYYKKSNYGDKSMDDINIDKSIGNNDIIMCTTYLSVGVDICDKYEFTVYFNEMWIPQDIEQFANRLRNNNLYIKLWLPKKNSADEYINYSIVQPLDLSFSQSDLIFARDLIHTCNDMLERNNDESKYSPIISNLLSANRYLKYDENDCKYYIDETTYKLKVFEERYSEYSKQFEILKKGMQYYGYTIDIIDEKIEIPEADKEIVEALLREYKNMRYNYITTQTFKFLSHINDGNIDIYKELLKGSYEIFRDEQYKEVRLENNLYVEDIEILEKNLPIVLSLYKFYDCSTIIDIYQYCVEKKSNKINYSKLKRIQKFVYIEDNRRKKRLDFPVYKFINDARIFANANRSTTIQEVNEWLANYAAKYANSIPNLIVEDIEFFNLIFDLIKDLWSVVIIQTRPRNGKTQIIPFELLWERKTSLSDIYGNINTKIFFLQELIDDMKKNEEDPYSCDNIDNNLVIEELPELTPTQKLKLDDVKDTLNSVIHSDYDYYVYSEEDNSNRRFIQKQINTNQLRDSIFEQTEEKNDEDDTQNNTQSDLFTQDENNEDLPF